MSGEEFRCVAASDREALGFKDLMSTSDGTYFCSEKQVSQISLL